MTEVYTTDGEIVKFDLTTLSDDEQFFPMYEAVWLYRSDLDVRHPTVVTQLCALEGRISEKANATNECRGSGRQKW